MSREEMKQEWMQTAFAYIEEEFAAGRLTQSEFRKKETEIEEMAELVMEGDAWT